MRFGNETAIERIPLEQRWHAAVFFQISLIVVVVLGNFFVMIVILCNGKFRRLTTNKFIASLAVSDLLVGAVVMPISLYGNVNGEHWVLGFGWCQFHLFTSAFSTTASIIHLVAISLDRYFAIMFPTEYQRHSVSTSVTPYLIMIWTVSLAVSSTLLMERNLDDHNVCLTKNPQYLVLSSILSFFVPGAIIVYLYMKIFIQLHNHRLYIFGKTTDQPKDKKMAKRSLPQVIIEEVRSRRGSRLSQSGSISNCPIKLNDLVARRSSQPEHSNKQLSASRWRSPTICCETLAHNRLVTSNRQISIASDPPSMDIESAYCALKDEHKSYYEGCSQNSVLLCSTVNSSVVLVESEREKPIDAEVRVHSGCSASNTLLESIPHPNTSYLRVSHPVELNRLAPPVQGISSCGSKVNTSQTPSIQVPKSPKEFRFQAPNRLDFQFTTKCNPGNISPISSYSSVTSTSEEVYRRISTNSFGSSFTDGTDSTLENSSRRSSAWSTVRAVLIAHRLVTGIQSSIVSDLTAQDASSCFSSDASKKRSTVTKGNLKRIATQITRAIRRRRRESMAIKRESRATRLVAAILVAFLICWIPYFCICAYRGVFAGFGHKDNTNQLHNELFALTSWLGYAHSSFNPVIYTCLNRSFRRTILKLFAISG